MNEKWGLQKIEKVKTQLKIETLSEEATSGNGETLEREIYEKYIMGIRKSRKMSGGNNDKYGSRKYEEQYTLLVDEERENAEFMRINMG